LAKLFARLDAMLAERGFLAMGGQMRSADPYGFERAFQKTRRGSRARQFGRARRGSISASARAAMRRWRW
jgi:hypothetical protein